MASPGQPLSPKRFGDFMDARAPQYQTVQRWDGAARTHSDWDSLRRDPELWFRNGNCLVHLYGRGQSRRGPSFRVPFTDLLEASCYPLIERSLYWDGIQIPHPHELIRWSRRNPTRRVELYIPPPSLADKSQAFHYHVATRNFFAWVFRRSMVGHTLSDALVGLLHSMHEFRDEVDNNVDGLLDYLDEEGYLHMVNQPNHALAVLPLAEYFQMTGLYIRAFAHSVGMSHRLFGSIEYQYTSADSRKLIRRARFEMDRRLARASTMLKSFLDEELSEANLGIPSGARAHLERFRSFLLSFYTTKLGYYPPETVDSGCDIFDTAIYRTMKEDFEALYDLLVDDDYTLSHSMPPMAYGGICTIQLVHSFDLRHAYEPLDHPLPLLPDLSDAVSRRMSWLPRREKLKGNRRATAHAALSKASNLEKPGVAQNALVRAYQQFEEDSIVSPNRADRQEKVSLIDARKVRWILVYAIYQVLLNATWSPVEVEVDRQEANYHLSVSTEHIPPWEVPLDIEALMRRQTDFIQDLPLPHGPENIGLYDFDGRIEIKPDIDYFALTHKESRKTRRDKPAYEPKSSTPSRSSSLKRALSRSSTVRRSMRIFRSPSRTSTPISSPPSRLAYHEIVVHGYGNGTINVQMHPGYYQEPQEEQATWGGWDEFPADHQEPFDTSSPESMDSTEATIESPIDSPSPIVDFLEQPKLWDIKGRKQRRRDVVSAISRSLSGRGVSKRRPISAMFSDSAKLEDNYEDLVENQRQSRFAFDGSLSKGSVSKGSVPKGSISKGSLSKGSLSKSFSRHSMILPDLRRRSILPESRSMPVHIPEQDDDEPYVMSDDADWTAMHAFMDADGGVELADDDVMPAWEQYADLGGLTEMR